MLANTLPTPPASCPQPQMIFGDRTRRSRYFVQQRKAVCYGFACLGTGSFYRHCPHFAGSLPHHARVARSKTSSLVLSVLSRCKVCSTLTRPYRPTIYLDSNSLSNLGSIFLRLYFIDLLSGGGPLLDKSSIAKYSPSSTSLCLLRARLAARKDGGTEQRQCTLAKQLCVHLSCAVMKLFLSNAGSASSNRAVRGCERRQRHK